MSDEKTREFRLQAVLIVAVFALWYSARSIYFIGDDFTLLTEQLVRPFSLFTISAQFIMPVFKAFLSIGGLLFGGDASGYHLIIVVIHILNALMFYRILRHFNLSPMVSFFSSLLWAILPQYAESIFWITGSVHTFTLFFVFSSLLIFIRWHKSRKPLFLVFSMILAVLAFYTKESAVVLIFFIAAYLFIKKESFKKAVIDLIPHISLFAVMIISNQIIRHAANLRLEGYYTTNIGDYFKYFCYYTIYNLFGFQVMPGLLLAVLFFLFFVAILYSLFKTKHFPFVALYLLSLIPFIIVGKAPQRYSYIPSLWLIPPIVCAVRDYFFEQKNKILRALVFPLIILFIFVSLVRFRIEYNDYKNFGDMHKSVAQAAEAFIGQNGLLDKTYYIFVNDQSGWTPFMVSKNTRGFKKLWALRDKGAADLIYLDDLFNFYIRTHKNSDVYKSGTVVVQVSKNDALKSFKTGNYMLMRYSPETGFLGAKFTEEGIKMIEGIKKLPSAFIPYYVQKQPAAN